MMRSQITGPLKASALGPLDQRDKAWRSDLADIELVGQVTVSAYAKSVEWHCIRQTPMLAEPEATATAVSEILPGEAFHILDHGPDYCWGYSGPDHYVGYISTSALQAGQLDGQTARLGPSDALVFQSASIKSPILAKLPLGSVIQYQDHDEKFLRLTAGLYAGGYLHRKHLNITPQNWVEIARSFVGTPYQWGGRSRSGVDCSGLIQISRQSAGHNCRRDSDMIHADAAHTITPDQVTYGDIAWWPGHIGIMLDNQMLLHANAHWMACVIEPLADVIARASLNGQQGQPSFKRF